MSEYADQEDLRLMDGLIAGLNTAKERETGNPNAASIYFLPWMRIRRLVAQPEPLEDPAAGQSPGSEAP